MADDTAQGAAAAAAAELHRQQDQGLKCPRCDSANTKFCYYNNYSLAQPRHYCKTCRRYWTKGGALRNVPVGGGCRKNKRTSKSSSSSSAAAVTRLSLDSMDSIPRGILEPGSGGGGGLKFLNSLPSSLSNDFQLGMLPFTRLHSLSNSGACGSFDLDHNLPPVPVPGFSSYPASGVYGDVGGCSSSAGHGHASSSIASSIESLSSINQDLHWKLQQQRLAMFFGGQPSGQKTSGSGIMPSTLPTPLALESQQDPISLDLVGRSKDEGLEDMKGCVSSAHSASPAWYNTESSYYAVQLSTTAATATTMAMATNNNGSSNASMWNGTPWPAWNDMPQFGTLP